MINEAESLLDAVLADLVASWPLPGGAVAIVDAGGILHSRTFGGAAPDGAVPIGRDELFEIGSISKIMTATVIHQLIDEARFTLDAAITDLLPWCDPGAGETITVRHLLQHSSGIITGADAVPDPAAQAWSLRDRSRRAAPGEFFHYSNLGFILLGLAASAVTGRSLPTLVRERVLEPLRMSASIAQVANADRVRVASGSEPLDDDRPWLPGAALGVAPWLEVDGADGNVAASIDDLAVFVRALLGRGEADGRRILSESAFDRMIGEVGPGGEDTVELAGVPAVDASEYGLGINVESVAGRTVVSHGGGMVGYASFVLADLDAGIGVVVLTNANGDSPIAEAIARVAAALWIDGIGTTPSLDPFRWDAAGGSGLPRSAPHELAGRFHGIDEVGTPVSVDIRVDHGTPGEASARLILSADGVDAPLLWTWGERIVTAHPRFRTFGFHFDERSGELAWGGLILRRSQPIAVERTDHPEYLGSYRSYSPWFTRFRIVDREGRLTLIAALGVEAPGEDIPLVEVAPGRYRLGADPRLPETLHFGPVVDGVCIYVDRDGCRYSRSFTA